MTSVTDKPQSDTGEPNDVECVVGIGGTADCLDSLAILIASIPATLPFAYVIAQHFPAGTDHATYSLSDSLGAETELDVVDATDGLALQRGVIAVCPPQHHVTVVNQTIVVTKAAETDLHRPDIDELFHSLAAHWGPTAVGILLTGSGDEGKRGLQAISEAAGKSITHRPGPGGSQAATSEVPDSFHPIPHPRDVGTVLTAVASGQHDQPRRPGHNSSASSQAELDAFFALDYIGILLVDSADRILRANQALADITGYPLAELIGKPVDAITQIFNDPSTRSHDPGAENLRIAGLHHGSLISVDGSVHSVSIQLRAVAHAIGEEPRRIILIDDLARAFANTSEMAELVRFDQQTGLLSRSHFGKLVDEELRRARVEKATTSSAVIWINLDGFKQVNDTHGNQEGDAVLLQVADRIRATTSRSDQVGRLGGDEFGVLIVNATGPEMVDEIADQILAALREPFRAMESEVFTPGSVGIAMTPEDGEDADTLLHNAGTAMQSAKVKGGNTSTFFQAKMEAESHERAELRQRLAKAVRSREFTMFYQPIVSVATGQAVSVEALIRWDREGEIVSADRFIDTARSAGHLRAIGQIGRERVQEDLLAMDATPGLEMIPVGINLSPDELDERELASRVLNWEPQGGFERIHVEITEQTLLREAGQASGAVRLLKRLGAQICIDDFGTGYSNLALLDQVGPSVIKIDRSMLVAAVERPRARALLHASIQMVHALGAQVVVEGVEDEAQWALVTELGADRVQGFLVARPMPVAELVAWQTRRLATG